MTSKNTTALSKCLAAILLLAVSSLALDRQPNADYRARRVALAQKMAGGVAIMFAGAEADGPNAVYGFRQDNNFYYLSGWSEPGAALVIVSEVKAKENTPGRPYSEILFLPMHNVAQEKWTGAKLGADSPQAASITGFDRVASLDQMPAELARIFGAGSASVLLIRPGRRGRPRRQFAWSGCVAPTASAAHFHARCQTAAGAVTRRQRRGEVALIRKATDASMASHLAALQMIKPGLNEHDMSAVMQYQYLKHGAERPPMRHRRTGANSTVLHYSADDAPIQAGDVVVMDVAGEYSMYASDITRTAPATGKFTDRQREIYNIVLGAQQRGHRLLPPGHTKLGGRGSDSLYQVAYEYINSHGKDLHGQPLGQYFIHGLGHYVGLEVHDPGDIGAPIPGVRFHHRTRHLHSRRKARHPHRRYRLDRHDGNLVDLQLPCLTPLKKSRQPWPGSSNRNHKSIASHALAPARPRPFDGQ